MGEIGSIIGDALGIVAVLFLALLGSAVVVAIFQGKIDLRLLVSEKTGEASMSRFQLLMFTFVVAASLFLLVVKNGEFPEVTPEILSLLGISGGTYVIAKGLHPTQKTPPSTTDGAAGAAPTKAKA
jgi:hypothetical protein